MPLSDYGGMGGPGGAPDVASGFTGPAMPGGGNPAVPNSGSGHNWKDILKMLLPVAGGAVAGGFGGLAGLSGFASSFANEKYRQAREQKEQDFQVEKALGDQAHQTWQELSQLDLSQLGPEHAGIKTQLEGLNKAYIDALSADSPGGPKITAKESQQIIALGAVAKRLAPQVQQANADRQYTHQQELKQSAEMAPKIAGYEENLLRDAGVSRDELGADSMPSSELHSLAQGQYLGDQASQDQRQALGTKSPEALAQELQQQTAFKMIPPPPVSLGPEASGYLGLGAGPHSAADVETMQQRQQAIAHQRAAATSASASKPMKVTRQNPQTGEKEIWLVNPFTGADVARLGEAPLSAMAENRAQSAQALIDTGEKLKQFLADPKLTSQIGVAMGRYNDFNEFIGNPPPEFAQFAAEVHSMALAAGAMHGMRGVELARDIQRTFSGKHTPEALIASIDGLMTFPKEFINTTGAGGRDWQMKHPPVNRAGTAPASAPAGESALDAFKRKHGL